VLRFFLPVQLVFLGSCATWTSFEFYVSQSLETRKAHSVIMPGAKAKKRAKPVKAKQNGKKIKLSEKKKSSKKENGDVEEDDTPLGEQSLDQFLGGWQDEEEGQQESGDEDNVSSDEEGGDGNQKAFLASLKSKDPEFYKFLQENDRQLLKMSDDDDEDEEGGEEKTHELPDSLEVASDESDFEEEEEEKPAKKPSKGKVKVKKAFLDDLEKKLIKAPSPAVLNELVEVFR